MTEAPIEELKRRAKAGDATALQQLRESGFFAKAKVAHGFALSPAQRRLWVLEQMLDGRTAYNLPAALLLEGPLDRAALRQALAAVARRHESLRTTFRSVEGEIRQFIREDAALDFEEVDLTGRPETDAKTLCLAAASQRFDLQSGAPFRARLIRLAPERHVFVAALHHIAGDAWSVGVLMSDIVAFYRALTEGRAEPPPLKLQYKDYAARQIQRLGGQDGRRDREYWLQKFAGDIPVLSLPVDAPRAPVRSFAGAMAFARLDPELRARLERFSRAEGATLFLMVATLVKALLHRSTGAQEIIIGTADAGREHADLAPQIGFYVNTLALRDAVTGADTFRALLARVQQTFLEAHEHRAWPFDQVIADLRLDRSPSHSPLFDVAVQLHHAEAATPALPGVRATEFDTGYHAAKVDLNFDFTLREGELAVTVEFNADLFSTARVERMLGHLRELARAALDAPDRPIAQLDLVPETERARLLGEFNRTAETKAPEGTISEHFEAAAREAGGAVAIAFEEERVSYAELNRRANQLAAFLRRQGVAVETPVGVCMERSVEAVAAVLAIFKAGGVYLPLDPLLPAARLAAMIEDCRPACVLAHRFTREMLPTGAHCVDALQDAIAAESGADLPAAARGDNAAYVIYTSGSTGRPKGVVVEHRSFLNMVRTMAANLAIAPEDRCLAFFNCSFDPSLYDIFLPLLRGASLVLARREVIQDPGSFEAYGERMGLTVATFTPSFLATLDARRLPGLRHILTGGEAASEPVAKRWAARLRYINAYGPTETSVISHWTGVDARTACPFGVPIGWPLPNTRSYILDAALAPVPIGVPGEIFIAGAGLARGYLRRPALTAERFLPDPFSPTPGGRMYRTGDLGRYREDGAIEFLGRVDFQVKVRGHRVEPGEIEAALEQCPGVRAAAVVLHAVDGAEPQLIAYCCAGGEAASPELLRAMLRARLPHYMVPARFVFLEMLPLTLSGKIDRKALPAPDEGESISREGFVAPRDDFERLLARAFTAVLGVERIGVEDNFFELGGDSLRATRLVNCLRGVLGLRIAIARFFEAPTVAGLAATLAADEVNTTPIERIPRAAAEAAALDPAGRRQWLEKARAQRARDGYPEELELVGALLAGEADHARIARSDAHGSAPLSFAQQRLWFLHRIEPSNPAYNVATAVRLAGTLDVEALRASLDEIVRRHEVLRASFVEADGVCRVETREAGGIVPRLMDLSALAPEAREAEAARLGAEEARQPFDLVAGPLLRLLLLRLGPADHAAVFTMHHVVSDAWSMGVLVKELRDLYAAFAAGGAPRLSPLPIQYADFSRWQRAQFESGMLREQAGYWREKLAALAPTELRTDRPRGARPGAEGAVHAFALPEPVARRLKEIARAERATLFMALLAAVQALLQRYTGREDVVVGTPIANRTRAETEPLIGFFVNTLVMRTDLSGRPSFRELLARARRTALEAFAHQDVPFEELVRELLPERDLGRNPLFQVMLTVQEQAAETLTLPKLVIEPLRLDAAVAKFDLTIAFEADASGLAGAMEYRTALFDAATIERMAAHLATLLEAAVAAPDQPVATLPLLGAAERALVLDQWNATACESPQRDLAALFREQAARHPQAVALECGSERLSYRELDERSEALAQRLRALGVGPEVLVGLLAGRSIEVVVALVAVMKAGGAYVGLDPGWPPARLEALLTQARIGVLLIEEALRERLPQGFAGAVLALGQEEKPPQQLQPECHGAAALDHLAYVSFTSGSTGRPKGVAVTQRGVVRLVKAGGFARMGEGETFLLLAPLSFDASTFEIWGALLNGARLVIMPASGAAASLEEIGRVVREKAVTTLWLTAGLFQAMVEERLEDLRGVRQLLAGGDVLSIRHVRRALEALAGCEIINGYGPTENTTFSACHRVRAEQEDWSAPLPIGRPIGRSRAYVLDAETLAPMPIGIAGELFLGGEGLARGYLGEPRLTAERFVPDPFAPREEAERGARLYRSGDLARWRADGTLEFLGRADRQLKVRGFRIEPAEIEAALLHHPNVREAVVVVQGEAEKKLVGYYVPREQAGVPSEGDLRAFLAARLPAYLVPARLVALSALPLNANGKIDRERLPRVEEAEERSGEAAPRDAAEALLVEVWRELLGRERVGIHDNYFALGGDSIRAIQLVSRVRRRGWQIEVRDVFEHPTIARLAPRLGRADSKGAPCAAAEGPVPLSAIQRWFFEHHKRDVHHFNQAVFLESRAPFEASALRAALAALHARHDALRMVYRIQGSGVEQVARREIPAIELVELDLRGRGDEAREIEAHAAALQAGIDLASGPLMKAALYRLPGGDALLLTIHHLAVDGVSWRILLEDLETACRQSLAGDPVELGPATDAFARWPRLQAEAAAHPALLAELDYWQAELAKPATAAPRDGESAENLFGDCQSAAVEFSEPETELLTTEAHRAYTTEISDLLLTALGRALRRWHGGAATRITLEGHGREPLHAVLDLTRTVGWFTSVFPFVLAVGGDEPGADIKAVKESLRAVPRKGAGFAVLRYLGSEEIRRTLGAAEPPRVSFNYLGQFAEAGGGLFEFAAHSTGPAISPRMARLHDIDITGIVARGRLTLSAHFHPGRHRPETIERLLASCREELLALATHCRSKLHPEKTPSDFTARALFDLPGYAAFLDAQGWKANEVEDIYPLSPMQEGLLFEWLFDESTAAYCVQMSHRLRGALDAERFAQSWRELCRRHEILRTAFVHEGQARPLQVVLRDRAPEIAIADLRGLPPAEQEARLREAARADLARRFDLRRDPLVRVAIFRLEDALTQVVWSYHHIVLDGWSLGLVHRELMEIYEGARATAPRGCRYAEYIRWLESCDREAARRYWAEALEGFDGGGGVPRRPAPAGAIENRHREITASLGAALSGRLRELAAARGVTLNSVVQALWAILLSRYNGTADVLFGAITSGRPAALRGVEEAIGLFIAAVPVRIGVEPGRPFAELLREVQARSLASEPHQHVPLAEIQAASRAGRDLFDHLLIFENYPVAQHAGDPTGPGFVVEEITGHDRTHYGFNLIVVPGDDLTLRISYDAAHYADDQVARTIEHLRTVASGVVEAPDEPVGKFAVLPESERQLVVEGFNATTVPRPGRTVLDMFDEQVRRAGGRTAIRCCQKELTYRELDAQASRLASFLRREHGLALGDRVGVLLDRSEILPSVLLGILKAGAAYVPIDPDYPPDRIAFIAADSACRVLITEACHRDKLPPGAPIIDVRAAFGGALEPVPPISPESLAYVIYTSGSTGRPKGCQIEHRNLFHYLDWASRYYFEGEEGGAFALFSSLAFDLTVTSLFLPLVRGKTLTIFPQEAELGAILAAIFREGSGIDSVKLTPSHLALLDQPGLDGAGVRLAIIGGEALLPSQVQGIERLNAGMRIYNEYGPTETTVGCIVARVRGEDERVLIGRPIDNTQAWLLDGSGAPVPIGVPGEIYIGGAGVGRGYLGRPDLDAERFVENPFRPAERVYRTGDVGRWLANGCIDYLGRNDHQVKIRGHRIELDEIEGALLRHEAVREAAVVVRDDGKERSLAAFVAGSGVLDATELRAHAARLLPGYMVPAHFVQIEALPLSPHGKVDRRALPEIAGKPRATRIAPRGATEERLAAIWQEVLQIEEVGTDENFFELGGHSLKAMQVSMRIERELGVKVRLRDFLERPTIAALAGRVRGAERAHARTIEPAPEAAHYALSHAQQRLWLLHHLGGASAYNCPQALVFDVPLDVAVLQRAFDAVVARHEALRTGFVLIDGEPRQQIHRETAFTVREIDLSAEPDVEASARELAREEAMAPFDLTRPPLLRAAVARLDARRTLFLLTLHHIISDGWSSNVLHREVLALYDAFRRGAPEPLRPVRLHYKDFAAWQSRQPFEREERYWLEQLAGAPHGLALPCDFAPGEERDFRGDAASFTLGPEIVRGLRRLAAERSTTLSSVVLALFKLLLFQMTRQEDFCIGMSVAGRDHPDLENVLGFFVNLLPIRTRFSAEMDLDALIDQVARSTAEAIEHQDYPFDLLVRKLNPQRVANRQPLLNVVYGFQNFTDVKIDVGVRDGPAVNGSAAVARPFGLEFKTSKFDLTLFAAEEEGALVLTIEFDTALFRPETIRRHLSAFERFARMACKSHPPASP
jgi:amino acid adenylation domain-containing protein/non-ribosomal peptide synthase protein (TIGR01720 family)